MGNKYLNEAAGIAAEEARKNKQKKQKVSVSYAQFRKYERYFLQISNLILDKLSGINLCLENFFQTRKGNKL